MKYIVPLVVASFVVAIATAMQEEGPLTLPFLVGYLLGIVVPVVVFSGVLTLLAAGAYRVLMRKDMPNLFAAMWSIWVLVAAVNFYGNYQHQKGKRAEQPRPAVIGQMADPYAEWGQKNEPWQRGADEQGEPSAVQTLQAKFARNSRLLDENLAGKVAEVRIPPLFDPEFLEDKALFPAAVKALQDYGQLFQVHRDKRIVMLSQMKREIEQLDLPQSKQQQVVHEFNNTYEIDEVLSQKYLDIVIEVSRQGIAYLDLMDLARYRVSNGRVMFEMDNESGKYQAFLQIFKRLSEQEVTAQRELTDSRKQRMARLRALSPQNL